MKYSQIVDIISGGTPNTSVSAYWNGDIPWLSVVDFSNEEKYVSHTQKTITIKGLKNSNTKLLQKGDIIISARGTVGAMAMLTRPMTFNQSCFGIRAKKDIVDSEYLFYLTKYKINELQIKSKVGSVFKSINLDTFNWVTVDLPDLPTQKRIASVLSNIDRKIALNRAMNEELDAMARLSCPEISRQ